MLDISAILAHWEYDPDDITVRLIKGDDGKPKIQMRLDLGLLQMNYDGRPDGRSPNGFESLYHFYQNQLENHRREYGSDKGFFLDPDDCESIFAETLQYYYRYLSLFHLQEFEAVIRDTERNLQVFEFVHAYAETEDDRQALEQYRPYVFMMNARARAHHALDQGHPGEAVDAIKQGIERISNYFSDIGRPKQAKRCREVVFLKELLKEVRTLSSGPVNDPVNRLRKKMEDAVAREDYESAALIRDEINKIKQNR